MLNAVKIETTIQTDGELHLTRLPCRMGDRVEAIILVLGKNGEESSPAQGPADEQAREKALRRFLARADASRLCSSGPYPSRDQLHERH